MPETWEIKADTASDMTADMCPLYSHRILSGPVTALLTFSWNVVTSVPPTRLGKPLVRDSVLIPVFILIIPVTWWCLTHFYWTNSSPPNWPDYSKLIKRINIDHQRKVLSNGGKVQKIKVDYQDPAQYFQRGSYLKDAASPVLMGFTWSGSLSVQTSESWVSWDNPQISPCSDSRPLEAPPDDFLPIMGTLPAGNIWAMQPTHAFSSLCPLLPGEPHKAGQGLWLSFLWVSMQVNLLESDQLWDAGNRADSKPKPDLW